jgi:hypothetical protein
MSTDNRNTTATAAASAPPPGAPDTASRHTAASRSRAYLSARLATREGSIGVFRSHGPQFQASGFDPKSR